MTAAASIKTIAFTYSRSVSPPFLGSKDDSILLPEVIVE